jgi:hypothetical protein
MRSKICASRVVIWACNDLVPQTWVIKPTMTTFVVRPTATSPTDTTDYVTLSLSKLLLFYAANKTADAIVCSPPVRSSSAAATLFGTFVNNLG